MRITFLCRRCYRPCHARARKEDTHLSCSSCGTVQYLRFTDSHLTINLVNQCVVCGQGDLYIRDEPRKVIGLVSLLLGLVLAYWTFGISIVLGLLVFDHYVRKFPKVTICYHCYASYQNCRTAPMHKEYDLQFAELLEKKIRNDRTMRDFP